MNEEKECRCGRSPTGKCIGWHSFTEQQYQSELKNYIEDKDLEKNNLKG